jgi:hypothetical protein
MRLPATPGGRLALWTAAGLAGLLAVATVVGWLTPTPSGPRSSSYATAPAGARAYAELLEADGRRVTRLRRAVARRAPGPRTTLVVLETGGLPREEATAIGDFVRGGGRLVVAGRDEGGWLRRAIGDAPEPAGADPLTARPRGSQPETGGVAEVRAPRGGELDPLGPAEPILGAAGVFAAVQDVGRGRVVVLADPSPLQNRALATADNAAFGLRIAGPPERPVAFLETVHGYGATGLAALPGSAKAALALLVLALVAFAWSHARRIGPAEREEADELAPARALYVDALAGTLERSRRPDAVGELLAAAARDRLLRRAALEGTPGPAALREAAERLGLPEDEARAIVDGVQGPEGALAAGRALARLSEREAVS